MRNSYAIGVSSRRELRQSSGLVLAALGNAMSILGEAMVLVAIPATCGYEARRMLLLAGEQTGRINDSSIHGGRARGQREARTQNHNQEENNKHRVTEMFFHKKLHVGRT